MDITYIRLTQGWMYLVAFLDWHSRFVVAWELSDTLELPFVLSCAEAALGLATPEIVNSDQVVHASMNTVILHRLVSRNVFWRRGLGFPWTGGEGTWTLSRLRETTSLRSACGDPSNMKRCTCRSTLHHGKRGRD